jgi:hypothetical protein
MTLSELLYLLPFRRFRHYLDLELQSHHFGAESHHLPPHRFLAGLAAFMDGQLFRANKLQLI